MQRSQGTRAEKKVNQSRRVDGVGLQATSPSGIQSILPQGIVTEGARQQRSYTSQEEEGGRRR